MKMLEHPDITRALRTGYPAPIKPVESANRLEVVGNDEFAEIIAERRKKEAKQNA